MKISRPVTAWTYLALVSSLLFTASIAFACNVPVFRYALERWPADVYELVVLHDGELTEEQAGHLATLKGLDRNAEQPANFNVRLIDVGEATDELFRGLWSTHGDQKSPLLVSLYPRNAQEVPDRVVSVHPLSGDIATRVIDSPVRQELKQRLLSGDSAVWVFVPSGDASQDATALQTLKEQVAQNQESLELPPQDEIEADEFFLEETPIELRLGFSIVVLDREDPREAFFLEMLLGSEPDLETLDQPMAFPVIGRGRVLYALVGKGIFRDTIGMASRFVVGPCSCQVKDQNPGFDLLLSVDWDEKLGGVMASKPPTEKTSEPILIDIPSGKK
ncbi:MAG: hypothetical protein ACR2NZ_08645 [Rubripirellula sp.]